MERRVGPGRDVCMDSKTSGCAAANGEAAAVGHTGGGACSCSLACVGFTVVVRRDWWCWALYLLCVLCSLWHPAPTFVVIMAWAFACVCLHRRVACRLVLVVGHKSDLVDVGRIFESSREEFGTTNTPLAQTVSCSCFFFKWIVTGSCRIRLIFDANNQSMFARSFAIISFLFIVLSSITFITESSIVRPI